MKEVFKAAFPFGLLLLAAALFELAGGSAPSAAGMPVEAFGSPEAALAAVGLFGCC